MSKTVIECPNCGESIDVNSVLAHQLEDKYKQEYDHKIKAELKKSEESLKTRLKKELQSENAEQLESMTKELAEKSKQVRELNKSKAEIEKLKREKDEMREVLELEGQKKLSAEIARQKEKIHKQIAEESQLKIKERETVIQQLSDQLKEAQKKAEQGSMQLQGEAQELAIEEWLTSQFPYDTIEEIKKGQKGADCLQTVKTPGENECGTIYYESKRTKSFQSGWIEKFKADMQERNASIGVLVTQTMPADMPEMGLRDGVWVCRFEEFRGLAIVLRESLIQINNALATQENKGDKMSLLYDFLTGNEFRMQIEAIVDGFSQMQSDLESEKRAMQKLWKQREKQIEKVLTNTTNMYGAVKGIAGSAIQDVKQLELGE